MFKIKGNNFLNYFAQNSFHSATKSYFEFFQTSISPIRL
jgi:hypothetical protein